MDVFSGFGVALLVWIFIVIPVWDLKVDMVDNLQITTLFTFVGIARRYIWRRIFNHFHVRKHGE
jgi:hypothetical protein